MMDNLGFPSVLSDGTSPGSLPFRYVRIQHNHELPTSQGGTDTNSSSAWIGSLQYSLLFLPCLVWGRLFDMGYFKSVVFICYILMVIATFLVAQCREYWQFLLCQGVAIGVRLQLSLECLIADRKNAT
jgi:MFS family permease